MSEGTLKIGTGIYLDDESSNIKLIDNTLYNNYHGIFVHNSHKDTIVGNIVVGNTKNAMYLWKDAIVPQEIRNLSIKTNVFIGFGYPAYAAVYGVAFGNSTLNDLGAINNNYLFSAASTTPITWNNFTENGTGVLSEWQNAYGHDMESKDSPIELPHNDPNMPEIIKLFTNETDQPTTTTLFANYVDLDGNPITYTELTLSPYSSKVLLRNDFGRMGTQKVKTYPNPIDDSLTFTIELPKGLDFYKVEVVDASGRIIYTEKPAFKHTNTISLMKPVAVGTYIVKITDPVSKKIYTSKIIKK
jgi:parallel beta-helix repeat protein